jgi:hypothetical protein
MISLLIAPVKAQADNYFILYQDNDNNLVMFNTATSEETVLLDGTEIGERKFQAFSNNPYVAVTASNLVKGLNGIHPEIRDTLYLFDLRDGKQIFTRELFSPEFEYRSYPDMDEMEREFELQDNFIEGYGGPRIFWSPDQTRLFWTEGTTVANEGE